MLADDGRAAGPVVEPAQGGTGAARGTIEHEENDTMTASGPEQPGQEPPRAQPAPPAPHRTDRSRMATPEHAQQAVPGPAEQPTSPPGPAAAPQPAPEGPRWRALTRTPVAVPAGAVLYLLGLVLPWFSTPGYDAGFGYQAPASTVNGFDAGMLVVAAALLVLAAAWTLLPRLTPRLPFPGALVPAGLGAVALLLTVPEWLTTFDRGFTPAGLLTVLSAAVACAVALGGAVAAVRAWPLPAPRPADPDPADDAPAAGNTAGESPAEQSGPVPEQQIAGSADDELWADPRRRRTGSGGASTTEVRR